MKRIARYIDYCRIMEHNQENKYCFSMEYLMEWFFSSIYWNWIRTYILYDTPAFNKFGVYLVIHFFTEAIESNLKWSELYFNTTLKIIEKYAILRSIIRDRSDLYEWRVRLSMDMMARFHSSILISMVVALQFIVFGKHNLSLFYGNIDYDKCMLYLLISTFIEFIHYAMTIGYLVKMYKLNPIKVFIDYVYAMSVCQRWCYVVLCAFFMIMYH